MIYKNILVYFFETQLAHVMSMQLIFKIVLLNTSPCLPYASLPLHQHW